jgi:thioredoxin reductase (NADPH)
VTETKINPIDVIVVGSGPSGLACAIEAKRAGLSCVVLEKGSLVDSIRRFPTNLVWFSTPELLEIGDVPFVVSTVRPTRVDTLNYYRKVVRAHALNVHPFNAVTRVTSEGRGFTVGTEKGIEYRTSFVVVATGYFDHPNRLGVPGEDLPCVSHYYTEPFAFADVDVVVVGGRNSAVEAALDLFRHGARVTLVHRGASFSPGVKYWILPDIENRIKAGEIRALFLSTVRNIREGSVIMETPEGRQTVPLFHCFVLIGFGPDAGQLRSFGITLDPETLAPRADEQTFETNVPGLFVAGSVVAGRDTNRIFVENGRLHGSIIMREILRKSGRIS